MYAAVFLGILLLFFGTAKADSGLLLDFGKSVFAGDEIVLSDYFDREAYDEVQNIRYTISDKSGEKDCVQLLEDGTVRAVKAGMVVIEVSYQWRDTAVTQSQAFEVTVLCPEEITAAYGTTVWLTAFNMYYPLSDVAVREDCRYTFSNDSAVLNEDGELFVQGFQSFQVYLQRKELKIVVANVTVAKPKFEKSRMARAKETAAFYPLIMNYPPFEMLTAGNQSDIQKKAENIAWNTADSRIAEASDKGIRAMQQGKTVIQAKLTALNGESCTIQTTLTVTDPRAAAVPFVIAVDAKKKPALEGVCAESVYGYPEGVSGYNFCSLNGAGKLCALRSGEETIEIVADGRVVSMQVVITNPVCNISSLSMYQGIRKNVTIKGTNPKYSTVTYCAGDKKLVAVSKKGTVRAKKVGATKITVTADGKKFTVWVAVATKTAYQAAQKEIAISKTKTRYSQEKRMSEGYYDCSSLVSRVYRKYGVYFGSRSGWAPTAAAIGQWCHENGKVIAKKGVSYTRLVPGDLVFYAYGKNGRYRNIGHVEMYVGDGMCVSASKSNNRVIYYNYNPNGVALIARPAG